jgi:hypothetical protein
MAHRLLRNVALVGIGIAIGTTSNGLSEAASRVLSHVGQVIDHEKKKPLEVSVTAWAEPERKGMNGSCPTYSTKLDDATSSPSDGKFKIGIEQSRRAYTLVYCLNGFVPRIDYEPNHKDGAPVDPTPAQLWQAKMEGASTESFNNDVERIAIGALNSLSYLMTVNEGNFKETLDGLASDFSESSQARAATIRNLRTLVASWQTGKGQ